MTVAQKLLGMSCDLALNQTPPKRRLENNDTPTGTAKITCSQKDMGHLVKLLVSAGYLVRFMSHPNGP